jgi:hypothetical protein
MQIPYRQLSEYQPVDIAKEIVRDLGISSHEYRVGRFGADFLTTAGCYGKNLRVIARK